MSKAICITSTSSTKNTMSEVENTISKFLGEEYKINDPRMEVFILKPIDGKINTDMINHYIDFLKTTSLNGEKKVGVIVDFELLSIQNQNKLLVYIEQINDNLLQVFTTTHIRGIISTIQSRLNILDLSDNYYDSLTEEQMNNKLYTNIINSTLELETYNKNSAFLDALYAKILEQDYANAFILYSIKIKDYDAILFTLIYKMLLSSITNDYKLAQKIIKLEKQLNSNSNKKLQMDNIFVTIMEGM